MQKMQTRACARRAGRPLGQLLVLTMLAAAATAANALPTYTCERVGGADRAARPAAINARGEMAGEAVLAGQPVAYKWNKNLKPTRLVNRAGRSAAADINDGGEVAGSFETPDGGRRAATWLAGVETRLGGLTGPKGEGWALGINNAGLVVGASLSAGQAWHATLWDHGTVVDLAGADDPQYSAASHVNELGLVVGYRQIDASTGHAVSWSEGRLTDLGALQGGAQASASASNRHGTIVGHSNFAGGASYLYRAVAWHEGVMTDLGQLPGDAGSHASAINDAGTIVGSSESVTADLTAVAWFRVTGGPIDLNTRLAGAGCTSSDGSPAKLEWATGINRTGQIAAFGSVPGTYETIGFRLTPQ